MKSGKVLRRQKEVVPWRGKQGGGWEVRVEEGVGKEGDIHYASFFAGRFSN